MRGSWRCMTKCTSQGGQRNAILNRSDQPPSSKLQWREEGGFISFKEGRWARKADIEFAKFFYDLSVVRKRDRSGTRRPLLKSGRLRHCGLSGGRSTAALTLSLTSIKIMKTNRSFKACLPSPSSPIYNCISPGALKHLEKAEVSFIRLKYLMILVFICHGRVCSILRACCKKGHAAAKMLFMNAGIIRQTESGAGVEGRKLLPA